MSTPWEEDVLPLIRRALEEDLGEGDVTSATLIPGHVRARGVLRAKEAGVLSGLAAAREVFPEIDPDLALTARREDGDRLASGDEVARLDGHARSILAGERVALNLLQHLSGVATLTARFVEAVAGTGVRILDTRKTLPGLRRLEKMAVRDGGGANHRMGLYDAVMIKDNHIAAVGSLADTLSTLRRGRPSLPVIVEVRSLEEIRQAAEGPVDRLLLDNFAPGAIGAAVEAARAAESARARKLELEVSGGVTLETVTAYARTGVDFISVGALTHSAPALDLSLEVEARRA